jgi:hypothetical protein
MYYRYTKKKSCYQDVLEEEHVSSEPSKLLRDAEKKSGAWQNGVISEKQNLKGF